MSRAREMYFRVGPIGGGLTFYPYQISLGISLRYWPCLYAPSIRIHCGPVKIWGYVKLRGWIKPNG